MDNKKKQILSLVDDSFRKFSSIVPLFPRPPVHTTQNISTRLGLANGSSGTVCSCQCAKDTKVISTVINVFP